MMMMIKFVLQTLCKILELSAADGWKLLALNTRPFCFLKFCHSKSISQTTKSMLGMFVLIEMSFLMEKKHIMIKC